MNEWTTKETESNDGVITSATDHMAFYLFSVLSDCYPEIATSEFEDFFNEEFKVDIAAFIKNYRKNIGNRIAVSGKELAQVYSNQRFYEKLSRALEQCKKEKADKVVFTVTNEVKAFQA
ncbi:hypothetical protein AADG43_001600 [Escherichia coli]|nr:hypothetical protein [Escherichia coli]MBB2293773.1 hypothetical protein [Escherichia coli]MCV8934568.1 hypothetical protein [Escherichia coli]HDU8561905.1 hypothetical protein [Escherichia coli]